MIPVLARNHNEFRRFLTNNKLSENKYFYVNYAEQLFGIERGSILLMFESYKTHPDYHEFINRARQRNMDCIRVI